MAHQAPNLPWRDLSDRFRYMHTSKDYNGFTNFVEREMFNMPDTVSTENFKETFASTIAESIASCRATLEDDLSRDDVPTEATLVSQDDARSMRRSIDYIKHRDFTYFDDEHHLCRILGHDRGRVAQTHGVQGPPCRDLLGHMHEMSNWHHIFACQECCPVGPGYAISYIKMWLSHGEMKSLYRLSRDKVALDELYDWYGRWHQGAGWRRVLTSALYPYLALNFLYDKALAKQEVGNYRLTSMYQRALVEAVWRDMVDVHKLPHRLFFGMPTLALETHENLENGPISKLYGRVDISSLPGRKPGPRHLARTQDIIAIKDILGSKGLPNELIDIILQLADLQYPETQLEVPDDPMHPDNAEKLMEYLQHCWDLMIRCGVLAEWCGVVINWHAEVDDCITKMFFYGLFQSQ